MDRLFNSRLRTSLVWGADPVEGLFPELDEALTPIVGPVPPRWHDLLHVRHLNDYYARIVECVLAPVEIETRPGLRRVSVLGEAVFEIDANGFVQTYLWCWRDGELDCFSQSTGQISIGDTPHGWTWLEMFRQGFMAELAWRLHCERDDLDDYARWVFARFRRRLARECNLAHMREQIRAALALDPLAVQVARRIRLACRRPLVTTLREYNHAIAYLPAYRKLQKEAPNLVPLFAAHADKLAQLGDGEPARQLKQHLMRTYGLSQATWALAHQSRPRWLYLIEHFYAGSPDTATADLLQLLQEAGFRGEPPRWYLWNLLQVFGNHGCRLTSYRGEYAHRGRALRRLTALIEGADASQLDAMRRHVYQVLAWIVDEDAHTLRGISRAGWSWFLRHAEEWRRHREKCAAALPGEWPVPFERFSARGHEVVLLRSHAELLQEARAMNHCVDTYGERCARGGHLVLSIRREGRTRPVATAHLRWDRGRWRVVHAAGAANSLPRPVAARLALEANARINALQWLPPQLEGKRAPGRGRSAADLESMPEFMTAADDILELRGGINDEQKRSNAGSPGDLSDAAVGLHP